MAAAATMARRLLSRTSSSTHLIISQLPLLRPVLPARPGGSDGAAAHGGRHVVPHNPRIWWCQGHGAPSSHNATSQQQFDPADSWRLLLTLWGEPAEDRVDDRIGRPAVRACHVHGHPGGVARGA